MTNKNFNTRNIASKKDNKKRFQKNAGYKQEERIVKTYLRNFDSQQANDLPDIKQSRRNDYDLN